VVSAPEGKQKGVVLSSGRSFAEVLHSVASVDGKVVGLRSLLVIPLDLLPKVACNELVNGEEEVISAVNCFEFDSWSSGSMAAASCIGQFCQSLLEEASRALSIWVSPGQMLSRSFSWVGF
jgi:hypothetical protein